jgi:hypothetical protein
VKLRDEVHEENGIILVELMYPETTPGYRLTNLVPSNKITPSGESVLHSPKEKGMTSTRTPCERRKEHLNYVQQHCKGLGMNNG